MIPDSYSVSVLSNFLISALRRLVREKSESVIVKAVRRGENLRVSLDMFSATLLFPYAPQSLPPHLVTDILNRLMRSLLINVRTLVPPYKPPKVLRLSEVIAVSSNQYMSTSNVI